MLAIMSKTVGKIYVIKYFGILKFSFWSFVQWEKLCTLLKIFFLVSIKVLLVRWRICLQNHDKPAENVAFSRR